MKTIALILLALGGAQLAALEMVLLPRYGLERRAAPVALPPAPGVVAEAQAEQPPAPIAPLASARPPEPPPAPTDRVDAIAYVAFFDFDSVKLSRADGAALRKIGRTLAPKTRVVLRGHTDRVGDNMYNADLGKRRAAAVRAALSSRAPEIEVEIESLGSEIPFSGRDGSDRRVEVLITRQGGGEDGSR